MMTPHEVSSKTFPKAVMGGYGMVAVDEFLDKLTEDYTALFKENMALKNKIKQLTDKIEEYRQVDDTMRATLLAAQKMADEMVAQAEAKRDAALKEVEEKRAILMGDAEEVARERVNELRKMMEDEEARLAEKKRQVDAAVSAEEQRLDRAKAAVGKFMEIARGNCQEQMKILQKLEEMTIQPKVEKAVEENKEKPEEKAEQKPEKTEEKPLEKGPEEVWEPKDATPLDRAAAAAAPKEKEPSSGLEVEDNFFTAPLPNLSELRQRMKEEQKEDRRAVVRQRAQESRREPESMEDKIRDTVEEGQNTFFQSSPEEATRVINLDELQFGRNYKRDD